MADPAGQLTIVDFSFSELDATPRQMDLDVAELLASLAVLAGEDRVVSAAAGVLGAGRLARAVPLLQPLALSAATRKAVARHDGLLARTRAAGLTGIGISSGPAVSAVLVYRLATYWLPVLPGWYSWRLLQRMDYL